MMNLIIQGINWGIIGGVAVVVGTAILVVISVLGMALVGIASGLAKMVKIIYHAIKAAMK